MPDRTVAVLLCALAFFGHAAAQDTPPAHTASQPKIRTITAFVRLDRPSYRTQVEDALRLLNSAKAEFVKAGYDVETIRITSQPFPEYTKGLTAEQALAFFREYDKLAQKEGFTPDIGPAMRLDGDDPSQADLLARIIAETQNINGFITVADNHGIHWNAVRAAARVVKYLEEHTQHSEGNFHFAAAACPPENAPFFPVSTTQGPGHGFAIGMESANIVNGAFAGPGSDWSAAGERLTASLGAQAKKVEAIARRVEQQS